MAKILLIDDEENARVLTAQFLELAGHHRWSPRRMASKVMKEPWKGPLISSSPTSSCRKRKGLKRSRISRWNDPAYPSSPFQGEGPSKAMSSWKWPFPGVLPQVCANLSRESRFWQRCKRPWTWGLEVARAFLLRFSFGRILSDSGDPCQPGGDCLYPQTCPFMPLFLRPAWLCW